MLHILAFGVLGIIAGFLFSRGADGFPLVLRLIVAVVAAIIIGELFVVVFGKASFLGKYVSLFIALAVACIAAAVIPKPSSPVSK